MNAEVEKGWLGPDLVEVPFVQLSVWPSTLCILSFGLPRGLPIHQAFSKHQEALHIRAFYIVACLPLSQIDGTIDGCEDARQAGSRAGEQTALFTLKGLSRLTLPELVQFQMAPRRQAEPACPAPTSQVLEVYKFCSFSFDALLKLMCRHHSSPLMSSPF